MVLHPGLRDVSAWLREFVERAGGQVVVIHYYKRPLSCILQDLDKVDGVIFTGGSRKRGRYFKVIKAIFQKVKEKKKAEKFFPCYGICLGFELLVMIVSGEDQADKILESVDANDQKLSSIQLTDTGKTGTVFKGFPPNLREKLQTDPIVLRKHKCGISLEKFQKNKLLSDFFDIHATSADNKGMVCVSIVQAKHYPITGFQFHPEGSYRLPEPLEDTQHATQIFADFLVRAPMPDVPDNCNCKLTAIACAG